MKLAPRDAPAYFQRPDPDKAGVLIHGEDAMRVAHRRQQLIAALIGPEGEAEMRLTRIPGADLRKDKALLLDGIKAQGFFPGPRVAFVEDATDGLAPVMATALEAWQPGDAQIVVTAGQLAGRSALRKLFESSRTAYAAGIYNDPPGRAEIEAALGEAGLGEVPGPAMEALMALSREQGPGDFRQTLEKVALYKLGDSTPLTPEEVSLMAPASGQADMDDVFHVLAEGRIDEIAPLMTRLRAQGAAPVTLLIFALRFFRTLHSVASDPGGPGQGIGRLRPPVFGPRRDRLLRHAQGWGAPKLEEALGYILDADLTLRSAGQNAPAMALVERCFIRLAMLSRR